MKKTLLISAIGLFLFAPTAMAQQDTAKTQEPDNAVTYVEDTSQGLLMNRMKDNWFITAEGGGNKLFTGFNNHRNFWNGVGPGWSLWAGKWFTPVVGVRAGINMIMTKGLSAIPYSGNNGYDPMHNGYYKINFNHIGPVADIMLNLHNWLGGYKRDRIWSTQLYAGGGGYWTIVHGYEKQPNGEYKGTGWKDMQDNVLTIHGGLINSFRLSEAWEASLDVRYVFYDAHSFSYKTSNYYFEDVNRTAASLQAYVGLTYKFPKRDWNGPMIPVCPPQDDIDNYKKALQDAETKISELETQLKACLDRPAPQPVVAEQEEHLATIYYPINVSKLTPQDKRVVAAIAQVMNNNPKTRYVVTGWADNYTGNNAINTRLRHARANGVKDMLISNGVNPSQFDVTINAGSLCDLGEKCMSLDRAVTIDEVK